MPLLAASCRLLPPLATSGHLWPGAQVQLDPSNHSAPCLRGEQVQLDPDPEFNAIHQRRSDREATRATMAFLAGLEVMSEET